MRITTHQLQQRAAAGEKLVMLTCYDASFAAISDAAGVDMLLIGDSLGMVLQGRDSTLAVTMEQVLYHVECVARGSAKAMVIADMPFGAFQESKEQAFRNAARAMAAGAGMVKLEGGALMVETTRFLVERGIPVCAHIGLTPQLVHTLGGYKVQGRTEDAATRLIADAQALESAGAAIILMEAMPAVLGERVPAHVAIEERQEGVRPRVLHHQVGAEALGEPGGEAGLAAADRPLDDDEALVHAVSILAMPVRSLFARQSRTSPWPGRRSSGAISASGASTKARSCARGCGMAIPGSSITASP